MKVEKKTGFVAPITGGGVDIRIERSARYFTVAHFGSSAPGLWPGGRPL